MRTLTVEDLPQYDFSLPCFGKSYTNNNETQILTVDMLPKYKFQQLAFMGELTK